jgi:hypothetical protein
MAEYYTVVKSAIGKLETNKAETRRTVYAQLRNTLVEELKAVAPPLSMTVIAAQRLELEEAIRKVERESVANLQPPRAPARPVAPPPVPNLVRAAPPSTPASPPAEGARSPRDLLRRATQQAASRGNPAGSSPAGVAAATERPTLSKGAELNQSNGATADLRPLREPVIERAPPVPGQRERAEPPAPDEGAVPRARPVGPAAGAEPRRSPRRDDTVEASEPEAREPDARPSRLRSLLLTALLIAVIVGAGALAWSKRVVIGQIIAAFDGTKATSEKVIPPAVPDSGAPGKVAEHGAGAGAAPAKAPGPVNPRPDDGASPAAPAVAASPAVAGAAATPALPADAGATPAPAGAAADGASPASPPPPVVASANDNAAGAPTGQKAVLHEEMVNSLGATSISATVNWRYVENGPDGPAIEADLQVPERRLKITLTIHKNADSSLPASHLVEIKIDAPPDLPGKSIQKLTRILMKPTADAAGRPLAGAEAKIGDGYFWIALSGADLDVPRNLALLRAGEWFDLPFTYETGQRAILTFEKGSQGDEVFRKAMAAWATG